MTKDIEAILTPLQFKAYKMHSDGMGVGAIAYNLDVSSGSISAILVRVRKKLTREGIELQPPLTWTEAFEYYKTRMNNKCVSFGSVQLFSDAMKAKGMTIATQKTSRTMHKATKMLVMDFIESQQRDDVIVWKQGESITERLARHAKRMEWTRQGMVYCG